MEICGSMNENSVVMYLVVNKSLNLTAGKIAAQIGHCCEKLALDACYQLFGQYDKQQDKDWKEYLNTGTTKIVLAASLEQWAAIKENGSCLVIVDEGRTECPPNSETVLGFFPMRKSEAPDVIKKLSLL